jgi:RimJ/RimL family protein N-acetyltransferase
MPQPTLVTERLILRPFDATDADDVRRLAGDYRVSSTTASIPHPYPEGAAAAWIQTHQPAFEKETEVVFAITHSGMGSLIGAVSLLEISRSHARAELGYWVAVDYWSQGLCTEAVRCLIDYAHRELRISRIVAQCLARNTASARVMEKAGLLREGVLRQHINHHGKVEDVYVYGLNLPGREAIEPLA